jgi:hypothetical protein
MNEMIHIGVMRIGGRATGGLQGSIVRQEKKAKPASAKLCEVNGHQWQKTTSDKVQRCDRSSCKIVRMLIRGHWKHFQFARSTGQKDILSVLKVQEQLSLWEEEEN